MTAINLPPDDRIRTKIIKHLTHRCKGFQSTEKTQYQAFKSVSLFTQGTVISRCKV